MYLIFINRHRILEYTFSPTFEFNESVLFRAFRKHYGNRTLVYGVNKIKSRINCKSGTNSLQIVSNKGRYLSHIIKLITTIHYYSLLK